MPRSDRLSLSRREREIMDVLLRLGRVSASDVRAELTDPPGYSAVRTMLGRLEDKGHVVHEQEGPRYVYLPAIDTERARETAVNRVVRTFFEGSPGKTVTALLDSASTDLSDDELDDLARLIERMREERK